MITVFMAQLHPTGDLNLDRLFHTLAYQASSTDPLVRGLRSLAHGASDLVVKRSKPPIGAFPAQVY